MRPEASWRFLPRRADFSGTRDPDGTPLNQQRRQKRLVRRQLRRRRERRRTFNRILSETGLLPPFGSDAWPAVMASEPLALRTRGLTEPLTAYEVGHSSSTIWRSADTFAGRDFEDEAKPEDAEAKKAEDSRASTLDHLPHDRRDAGAISSGQGLTRSQTRCPCRPRFVLDEFDRRWRAQEGHLAVLRDPAFRCDITDLIFSQRRSSGARAPSAPAALCRASRCAQGLVAVAATADAGEARQQPGACRRQCASRSMPTSVRPSSSACSRRRR